MIFGTSTFSEVPFAALPDGDAVTDTFRLLGPGRTPRLLLDFGGGCFPPHLQLFYLEEGGGLRRRSEASRFEDVETTPLEDDEHLAIETVIRTQDRRVAVLYSARDPIEGTYELRRLDSVPFPAAKTPPEAPRFIFTNSAYLPFYLGSPWRDVPSPTVNDVTIAVSVQGGTVHAVELECSSEFPTGYHPDFAEQVQEYNSGGAVLGEGHVASFTVSLTHGGGVMSPCAFRARCRDDTDPEVPCYSKWRYYLAGYYDPTTDPVTDVTPVGIDAQVCYPASYQVVAGGRDIQMTYEAWFVGERINSNCFMAAGRLAAGGIFTIVHDWTVIARAYMSVEFMDENLERFAFTLISIESYSTGEGNATVTAPQTQVPWDFE